MTTWTDRPPIGPSRDALETVFSVHDTEVVGETLRYYGEPRASVRNVLETVRPIFREYGYDASLRVRPDEHVLVARPSEPNVGVFLA